MAKNRGGETERSSKKILRRDFIAGGAAAVAGLFFKGDSDKDDGKEHNEQVEKQKHTLEKREKPEANYSRWEMNFQTRSGASFNPFLIHPKSFIDGMADHLASERKKMEPGLRKQIEMQLQAYGLSGKIDVKRLAKVYPDIAYVDPIEMSAEEQKETEKDIRIFNEKALAYWKHPDLIPYEADDLEIHFFNKKTQITDEERAYINTKKDSSADKLSLNIGGKESNVWPFDVEFTADTDQKITAGVSGEILSEEGAIGGGAPKVYSIREIKDDKITRIEMTRHPIIIFESRGYPLELTTSAEILHAQVSNIFSEFVNGLLIGSKNISGEVYARLRVAQDLEEMVVHTIDLMFTEKMYNEDELFRKKFDEKMRIYNKESGKQMSITDALNELKGSYRGLARVKDHFDGKNPQDVLSSLLSFLKDGSDSQIWQEQY